MSYRDPGAKCVSNHSSSQHGIEIGSNISLLPSYKAVGSGKPRLGKILRDTSCILVHFSVLVLSDECDESDELLVTVISIQCCVCTRL